MEPIPIRADRGSVHTILKVALLVLVIVLALLAAAAAFVGVRAAVGDCRLTSVDETEYVTKNIAYFRQLGLPVPDRDRLTNSGGTANNSCLPVEDDGSPPYDTFATSFFIFPPGGLTTRQLLIQEDRSLIARGCALRARAPQCTPTTAERAA